MKLPEVARRRSVETKMVGERIRQTMLGMNSSGAAKSINSILMTVCQGATGVQQRDHSSLASARGSCAYSCATVDPH